MKNMFLALLMFISLTTMAQEKKEKKQAADKLTSEQKVDLHVKRMTKDLSLNDQQVKEAKVLVTKQIEKREKRRIEMQELKAQKRKEFEAEQIASIAEMKKILNSEQFVKWEKIREERKEKMKEKMSQKKRSNNLNTIPDEK